jgi:hypothetical protein
MTFASAVLLEDLIIKLEHVEPGLSLILLKL